MSLGSSSYLTSKETALDSSKPQKNEKASTQIGAQENLSVNHSVIINKSIDQMSK